MSNASSGRYLWALICGLAVVAGCQQSSEAPSVAGVGSKRPLRPAPQTAQPAVTESSSSSSASEQAQDQPKPALPPGQPATAYSTTGRPATGQPATGQPAKRPTAVPKGKLSRAELSQIDPADLVMPKVSLSWAHAQTCLVKVGDPMPATTLPGLDGKHQSLAQLLGERLTLVVFWSASNRYSVEELADLEPDVAERFGERGVQVVAINELDKPQAVRELVRKLGVEFPNLLDADGAVLSKVATRSLPRTYLLDASGKILWFDLEYSRSTRRELLQAIQFVLSQG